MTEVCVYRNEGYMRERVVARIIGHGSRAHALGVARLMGRDTTVGEYPPSNPFPSYKAVGYEPAKIINTKDL